MAYTAADPNLYGPQPAAPPPPPSHHYDPSTAAPPYHHHQHPPQPYYGYYPNPSPVMPHENPAADPGGYAYPPEAYAGYPTTPPAYSYPPPGAAAGAPAAPYYYGPPGGVEGPPGVHPLSYPQPMMMGTGKKKTSEDLEMKKWKLIAGGTAPDSVRICSPCNIVCNSDVVFADHLAGEKHAQMVFGQSSNATNGLKPVIATHIKPHMAKVVGKGSKKNTKVVQSVYCEVCKLECNSRDIFNYHKVGKKHTKNLLKLQESIMVKPVNNPSTAGIGIPNKVKPVVEKMKKTGVDLETKKRKMLDAGTAADAVKVCTVCNVACNSQTVFNYHLVGHKHISMVKQQQQSTPAN